MSAGRDKTTIRALVDRPSTGSTIDYGNARVRSRRTGLLSADELTLLIEAPDITTLVRELSRTRYAPYLERYSLTAKPARAVGLAAAELVADEYGRVVSFYPAELARRLVVLATAWDIEDVKTVVRAAYAGQPPEDTIASFIGAGVTIGRRDLVQLAREGSVGDVVSLASTLHMPYARTLRLAAARYAEGQTLAAFESVLDQEYALWASRELGAMRDGGGAAGAYFRTHTDARNIMTALRWQRSGGNLDAETTPRALAALYLLEGGAYIDLARFRRMVTASSVEQAVDRLAGTPYGRTLSAALPEYLLADSLAPIDRALSGGALATAIREGRRDVLGMGLPVAYLLALQAEAANLRVLARGKAFGIPTPLLETELTRV